MDLTAEIRKMVETKLAPGQFLVDVIVTAKNGPGKVLVLVDGDEGVDIDQCGEISRSLSKDLDDSGWLSDQYMLEVSTPGVDQPLRLKRQYKKHVGRKLKVTLAEKVVEGKLTDVGENKITLNQEIGSGKQKEIATLEIPFGEIEKALVLVSFK
jgi:ribosome maturation factor RimP